MPVTQTAKKALRVSQRKFKINQKIKSNLESVLRIAKKTSNPEQVNKAMSLTDRAVKKDIIHKNKAARIKSRLSKLVENQPKKKRSTSK